MLADLPPSSRATRLTVPAATSATRLPARVEPVKQTMSTSGWAAIASPTTGTGAGHQVEHAGGQADLVDDLGEDERVERRHLARLEHDGAAGGERGADLADDLVERVVPRRDRADDADRLLDDEGVADLLFELERVEQRGEGAACCRRGGRPGSWWTT